MATEHHLLNRFSTAIALGTAAAIALGWLVWKCTRDPNVNFLPQDSRAEWILFPAPLNARSHDVATTDATFRRTFTLESQPRSAQLLIRAAKRLKLTINDGRVPIPANGDWKEILTADVSNFLHSGDNTIVVGVSNDDAPPALWLSLKTDSAILGTDVSWEASLAGSSWRNCVLATVPRRPRPGNVLGGGERVIEVLRRIWPLWIAIAVLAVLLTLASARWLKVDDVDLSRIQVLFFLGICVLAWLVLFWNNAKLLPFHCGYDFTDHLSYIKYIQDRRSLPLPNEGYEMFQPPLYYTISAGVLSICGLSIADEAAVIVLRALTMIFGIANFIFVFLSVRLLFPRQRLAQMVGLAMGAFLPMQLYLSHYATNETLAGTLASAAIYFALRILRGDPASSWFFLALGVLVGAAMLAKTTSLLLIPPLLGALIIKLGQERAPMPGWLRALGITIAAIFVTCGWHYIRIWRHFGTPIVGNWDRILGFPWWQDPGFHTTGDYFRFGRTLITPLFSGFNGFLDGIYSTLWGDSLGGGLSGLLSRTPWNYELMIGGYWPALIPTLLVVIGAAITLYRFISRPSPEWFLLIGFSAAVVLAVIFMTLRVPSYAQVKAFYGLTALVPFCCFAAQGWQTISPRSRTVQLLLGAALVFVSANSFVSVWIRPSADQHIYTALRLISQAQADRALGEATAAVKSEPSNANASYLLAAVLDETGDPQKSITQSEHGLELDPANGDCHLQLAITLAKQGQLNRAMSEGQRALELLPESARAHDLVLSLNRQLRRSSDALTAGRDALAVSPYDGDLHYRFGLAAGEMGDFKTAADQFAYASLLEPNRSEVYDRLHLAIRFATQALDAPSQLKSIATDAPESPALLNELSWIFATHPDAALRDGERAVALAERACELTERKQPALLATLAAAYAEAGRFSEAINVAREATSLAQANADAKTARLADNLLTLFRSSQAYREEPR